MYIFTEYFIALLYVNALFVLIWFASLYYKDASLIDRFWGIGFVAAAFSIISFTPIHGYLAYTLLFMVVAWGMRLSLFLSWRNWGHGEDIRYQALREQNKDCFKCYSLYKIYMFQALILWIVAAPVCIGLLELDFIYFNLTHILGFGLWVIGFLFESIGDWQLARFKSDKNNKGKVMNQGLWRFTRHPNYFGEILIWWGIYIFVCSGPMGFWTIFSPILITLLILKVSGVPLTESRLKETREGYQDYIQKTNKLIPGFPRN